MLFVRLTMTRRNFPEWMQSIVADMYTAARSIIELKRDRSIEFHCMEIRSETEMPPQSLPVQSLSQASTRADQEEAQRKGGICTSRRSEG
jgi:hypothetical protein